ncbi:MAG: copper resistance protein NlpE N-terminal domain-containing protein [Burkholderiaceae bacterium]|nr:copper resistance protein NlpE N-terminal domain-containing protein [Burkholderiaceae bacterium]
MASAGARTYSGTYSCAGCIERTLTVTIFADGSYRLREVPARGEPLEEQGRWSAPREAPGRLVLESAGGERVLQRTPPDSLTIVDPQGRELHGLVGGVLARSASVDPLSVSRRLTGLYRSGGGQHLIVDCASGETLAVLAGPPGSAGSAHAALEAAWTELAPRDDESVLVVVRAHRAVSRPESSAGAREAIVVDAFERAMRSGCDAAPRSR